jgi:hypothetical protein
MIKSINTDNNQIILDILELHVPSKKIDVDLTYSAGGFYKDGRVAQPTLKFDLFPQTDDTVQASSENIPLTDSSVDSVMFDPLFVCGSGPSNNSIIRNRFSCLKNMQDVWAYYDKSLIEIYRVLRPEGICIFKCQDTVSGGKQYFSHVHICNEAQKLGFYAKDLFVLLAKSRLSNWKNQYHARKFHCYYWVFQKLDK